MKPLRRTLVLASALLLAGSLSAQTQNLGPWTLSAPDSAQLIAGGSYAWGWLNVQNVPVTVDEAFSGLPLDDDGYANASPDTVIQCHFQSGVTNQPGDDLVMFDAQYDYGVYDISTEYDGFTATVTVDTDGGTTVSNKDYYYGGGAINPAEIVGVAVDLSDLGVPAGAVVYNVRFACVAGSPCDPVGLGNLTSPLELTVSPAVLAAGAPATVTVSGAIALGQIGVAYSLTGAGPVTVDTQPCGWLTLAMTPPIRVLALLRANAAGNATMTGRVPAGLAGATLHLQALDLSACRLSAGVTRLVL